VCSRAPTAPAVDVWLFAYHGIAQSLRQVLYSPVLLMLMLGLVMLSAAFHECGHATACAYGGARPGVMGGGSGDGG
jgi:putative peptide zinc metalloprotease protein